MIKVLNMRMHSQGVSVVRMIKEHEAGPLTQVFAEIREQTGLGLVPAVFRVMAAVGADVLIQNWAAYRHTVLEGLLPRGLKEMAGLVVARAVRCSYGVRLHSEALAHLGISEEVIQSLAEHGDAAYLSLRERAALRFVEGYHGTADDLSVHSLEALGFSEEEIAEVTDAVLLIEGLCRVALEAELSGDEL